MPGSCVRYGSIVWSAGDGWISQVLRRACHRRDASRIHRDRGAVHLLPDV